MAKAKDKAHRAVCTSNLRQIGMTYALYTGDNREQFPYSGRDWPQMGFVDLLKLLNPYIQTNARSFYLCPSEKGRGFNIEWALANNFRLRPTNFSFHAPIIITTSFIIRMTAGPCGSGGRRK